MIKMNGKKFNPTFEKELYQYLKKDHPAVAEFEYEISKDNVIRFTGVITSEYDAEKAFDCIQNLEKMMDATYLGLTNIKSHFTFIYQLHNNP
jgi:hypothetical protein